MRRGRNAGNQILAGQHAQRPRTPISVCLRRGHWAGFHLILRVRSSRLSAYRDQQMSGRRSKLFVAFFAVALNVVSAPLAWARMSASFDHAPSSAMAGIEHCAGHMDADDSNKDSSSEREHGSCCSGGQCACGCLPVAMLIAPNIQGTSVAPISAEAESEGPFPAKPFEDPLRPPIS
jgi:hypothetical protein